MSRARAESRCRRFATGVAPVALAVLAAFSTPSPAQQATGLRGGLVADAGATRADPLDPPAPAEPLQPLQPAPLAVQGAMATPATTPRPRLQVEDTDDELDGAPADDESAARARQRARATLPDPNLAARPAAAEQPAQASAQTSTQAPTRAGSKAAAADAQLSTGTVRTKSIDAADLERNTAARPQSERAAAIEGLGRATEQNPFDPVGLRVGSFLLRPTLDQGIEWTSNATNTAGGSSDFVSETTLRLDATSDWARHSASLNGYGTYRSSVTGSGYSEFRGGADAALGLELGDGLRLDSRLAYERKPEDASSPVDIVGAIGRPLRQTLTASTGLATTAGKLQFGVTANASRDIYGDAPLAGGGTLSQADRNQTLVGLTLRGGYEASPALTPFVEAELGRRLYDNRVDAAGYSRSANRLGARAGLSFDLGEKLNGEVAAGWLSEKPDDTRLSAVSGLSAAGNLQWSPVRGTIVNLTGSTQVEGSTTPSQSGSILYSSTLGVSRELRANLTGSATLGADWRRYTGTSDRDFTWSAETSLTWWLGRHAGLKARARHEETTSTIAGRASQANSVYLGLTLRR